MNKNINRLHKWWFRTVYSEKTSSLEKLSAIICVSWYGEFIKLRTYNMEFSSE